MTTETVDDRLEQLAEDRDLFQEVLEYHRDSDQVISPFALFMTVRTAEDLALYFDSGDAEWAITGAPEPDGIARYHFWANPTATDPSPEYSLARDLEDLLEEQLPEIVKTSALPIATNGTGRCSAGP